MLAALVPPSAAGSRLTSRHPGSGIRLWGAPASEAGLAVAPAGDVNGDGRDDVIVGADATSGPGAAGAGAAYVVFGDDDRSGLDLAELGDRGFAINGAMSFDFLGWSVAGLGDVDGDGLDDVVVGAPKTDHHGGESGSAYVVFGKSTGTAVNVATPGSWGYRIDGAGAGHLAGWSVAGPGDIDGDGSADVLVGAPGAGTNAEPRAGYAYVVFGQTQSNVVDLTFVGMSTLGGAGYRIVGAAADDETGWSVSGAGDVDGDGRPDLAIGAPLADPNGPASGTVYVVLGQDPDAATYAHSLDLAELGEGGYRIAGPAPETGACYSVAGGGDVDGDGRPDVLLGAPGLTVVVGSGRAQRAQAASPGAAYVAFGRASLDDVDLSGSFRGITVRGGRRLDRLGHSVAIAGDLDRDGKDEYAAGAPQVDRVFVGLGRGSGGVDADAPDGFGTWMRGPSGTATGWSVAGGADFDGDGRGDLVVGAPDTKAGGETSGAATVVTRLRWRITARGDRWTPEVTRARQGDTVVWRNRTGRAVTLRSFGPHGSWRETIRPGDAFRARVRSAGVYEFRDAAASRLVYGECSGRCGRIVVNG
jgi:plastocyanin